jgi:hypothetical protein
MSLRLLLVTALVGSVFAGCLQQPELPDVGDENPILNLLAGPALWPDPQNTPHPAFGWPTVSHPATANGTDLPAFWEPIPEKKLPTPLGALKHVVKAPDVPRGGGIALFGSLAVVPGYGQDSSIVDISDPENPKVLSHFKQQEGMGNHRGATIIAYPDGRLVTVISTAQGLDVWDITDPTQPEGLTPIKVRSHKVGVVPGTPIVYNAPSGGGGAATNGGGGRTVQTAQGVTQIYDLTDPENPVHVKNWTNGFGCHHVYFWNDISKDKYRGICAGIEYTQLWDLKDPLNPKVIVSVPVHHGVANSPSGALTPHAFSHYAGLSKDGRILLVGDENGGGGSPPGCVASVSTPAGAVSTPVGALWFYDVSTETNPRLLGWYSPLNDPRVKISPTQSCTAHHGRLVPAEGRDVVAMSFYGMGVVVVDFTGIGSPSGPLPKVVAQFADQSDTWETWYYNGYLFTGDLARGMDVLAFS